MNDNISEKLFQRAVKLIPGGVNSPVRAFKSVGRTPLFIDHAIGSKIYDVDKNEYIDYVGSWGPLILGHAHPVIIEAVIKAAEKGTSFGASTEAEIELAEMIINCVPSVEIVRLVNSGTEATMSAVRLARAYTERDKIVKFAGCYHGHADSFLIKAGSGAATFGVPSSAGVTNSTAKDTVIAEYNNISSVKELFLKYPDQIAAIIVEPVPANIGVILPDDGFLTELRNICTSNKSLLIFDEVITGFRVSLGGAQQLYNVIPDITTLGKIIGGGLPIGAYGGKKEIMEMISPNGPVYQAGTLSGNPVAVAAGKATLNVLSSYGIIDKLNQKSIDFYSRLKQILNKYENKISSNSIASMSTIFFNQSLVKDYESALSCDTNLYSIFFNKLLENGIYMAPSQFEAGFISSAHSDEDLDKTIMEIEKALNGIFNI